MGLVRTVHLVSAVMWPAAAVLGSWRARGLRRRRARVRLYLVMSLGLAVGLENLAEALSPVHPASTAHLLAEALLAAVGILALYLVSSYGAELVTDERVVDALVGRGEDPPMRPAQALSPRELQVLERMCRGGGPEEIGRDLGISPHTAATHIRNLMRKIGARTRGQAVGWAVRTGLYDPAEGRIGSVGLELLAPR